MIYGTSILPLSSVDPRPKRRPSLSSTRVHGSVAHLNRSRGYFFDEKKKNTEKKSMDKNRISFRRYSKPSPNDELAERKKFFYPSSFNAG